MAAIRPSQDRPRILLPPDAGQSCVTPYSEQAARLGHLRIGDTRLPVRSLCLVGRDRRRRSALVVPIGGVPVAVPEPRSKTFFRCSTIAGVARGGASIVQSASISGSASRISGTRRGADFFASSTRSDHLPSGAVCFWSVVPRGKRGTQYCHASDWPLIAKLESTGTFELITMAFDVAAVWKGNGGRECRVSIQFR